MSRYRNSEEPYGNRALGHYKDRVSDRYLASRPYSKPYSNPRPTSKYSGPSVGRGARGRHDRSSRPEYFQSPNPEKKYETVSKPEKMSSPPLEKTPRYRLENGGMQTWVDTEQIVKEVERRMDGKLTEQLLEKLRAELGELVRNAEKAPEGSNGSPEPRTEPRQEIEKAERNAESDHGQSVELGAEGVENDGGTPEVDEELKDESLKGSFILSRPFGLAIPTEVDEAELERTAQESENQKEDTGKESGIESHENEPAESESQDGVEESEEDAESKDEEKAETVDETGVEDTESKTEETEIAENIESREESGEEVNEEALEDIATEGLAECEETGEAVPEEAITEQLPEETELFPIEAEPMEIV